MFGKQLISIIIPVYNVEPYLHRCLDSVINQTYKNLEIILIDDGSTDKSGEICEEYKKKDSRIIVIHQKNQGLSAARNAGLDIFKGEYVSFIDSDDYVEINYIEFLYNAVIENRCNMSVCLQSIVQKDGEIIKKNEHKGRFKISAADFIKTNTDTAMAKLYKSFIFSKIRFPPKVYNEDHYIFAQVSILADSITIVHEYLYNYCIRQGSITNMISESKNFAPCISIISTIEYLNARNFDKTYISNEFSRVVYRASLYCFDNSISKDYKKYVRRIIKKTFGIIKTNLNVSAKFRYFMPPIFYRLCIKIKKF